MKDGERPATRWALYDARGVLAGTYATRELAEADAYGPRFRGGHTIAARRLVGWRIAVLATGPHGGWQRVAAVTHVLRIAVTPIGKQRGCLFPMREDAVREARGWTNHQTRLIRVYRMRRLVGYRVTWRHTGDPRQMLYTLAESEHARSYARAGADNLRRVQAITDVRVWRVYRRRRDP